VRPLAAVTGGTGFVGRHVVRALAAEGWRVRLLVRRNPRLDLGPDAAPVELVPGALGEPSAMEALVDGADAVIHCAGAVAAPTRAAFFRANRDGTRALAGACARRAPRARRIILSSLAARAPWLSAYAASKAAGETAAGAATILRPAAIYGPGDRATLMLFRAAMLPRQPLPAPPGARVSLIHVADVARAVTTLAARDAAPATFELTDENHAGLRWDDLVAAACHACGTRFRPLRVPSAALRLTGWAGDLAAFAGTRTATLTSAQRRELLHPDWGSDPAAQPPAELWRPVMPVEKGFAETVAWYRAAGWLPPARP